MSATRDQANVLMARFRALVHANAWLFTETRPDTSEPYWIERESDIQLRLRTGAELLIRSFRTSTRGLHPDLLVLDDVLSDENSGTDHQRRLTYRYFTTTLLPMHPGQLIVVGTALHQADLLHRLKPTPTGPVHGFEWRRYRALNERGRTALWPERHPHEELVRLRDADPSVFSREYQNLPTDERSTFFPSELTQQAIAAGARLTLVPFYQARPTELMIMGADLARSERIGADYTVAIVVAYDIETYERRVVAVRRERGLDFEAQIAMFTGFAVNYGLMAAYIESNGFQRWLVDALRKRPGGHVFFGDATGRGRMRLDQDGIPILAHALQQNRWVIPSGNEESREFARAWQASGWSSPSSSELASGSLTLLPRSRRRAAGRADRGPDEEPRGSRGRARSGVGAVLALQMPRDDYSDSLALSVSRSGRRLTPDAVRHALSDSRLRAGVDVTISPHVIRHWHARDLAAHDTHERLKAARMGWQNHELIARYAPVASAELVRHVERYSPLVRLRDAGSLNCLFPSSEPTPRSFPAFEERQGTTVVGSRPPDSDGAMRPI